MILFEQILTILAWLFAFFLLWPLAMTLLSRLLGRTEFIEPRRVEGEQEDFACIITAYKDLDIARPLAESLLLQEYANFRVYLVADQCGKAGPEWTRLLNDPRMTFLRPEEGLCSKVSSMIYARERFTREHSSVVIFDPDNLAPDQFLCHLDQWLSQGFVAVQGRRAAKNLDTLMACADATGELYKNWIERETPTRLGSSATIAGSGMAIKTLIFDQYLASPRIAVPLSKGEVISAEDKILQNFLVRCGYRIPFAWKAILYDEKVESGEQVVRQRTRWTYSYFENVQYALGHFFRGLFTLRWNALMFSVYTLIPPLFLLIAGSGFVGLLALLVNYKLFFQLLLSGLAFVGHLLWSLRLAEAPQPIWDALGGLPVFAWNQFKSLTGLGRARKDFMVTEKRKSVSLEDLERSSETDSSKEGS